MAVRAVPVAERSVGHYSPPQKAYRRQIRVSPYEPAVIDSNGATVSTRRRCCFLSREGKTYPINTIQSGGPRNHLRLGPCSWNFLHQTKSTMSKYLFSHEKSNVSLSVCTRIGAKIFRLLPWTASTSPSTTKVSFWSNH